MTPAQTFWHAIQARRTLPHGQRPTDTHILVLRHLTRWQHDQPDHAKLAKASHCHRNTVRKALQRFRALGLLTWRATYRLIGGKRYQGTNRYHFVSNAVLPTAKARKERRKSPSLLGPQSVCTGENRTPPARSVTAQLALFGLPEPGTDLLAARRKRFEEAATTSANARSYSACSRSHSNRPNRGQ